MSAIMPTADQMAQAMQLAWNDHVLDTGCYPDCLTLHGSEIRGNFAIGSFADSVTKWLAVVMERGNGS